MLAKGIVSDFPPLGVTAEFMHYEASGDRLITISSTDFQSFDSIVRPWELKRHEEKEVRYHPGICVRAFRQKKILIKSDMTGEEIRRGEPLCAMFSVPIIDIDEIEDGDLAILNVDAFVRGYIPESFSKKHLKKLETVKSLAIRLNALRRQLKKGAELGRRVKEVG